MRSSARPRDDDRAVLAHHRPVAGDEPLAAEGRGGLLGPPPVAEHQPRVAARHREQPFAAARHRRVAVLAEHRDPPPGLREAGRPVDGRPRRREGDVGRDLRHAHRLVDRLAGRRAPGRPHRRRQRLAGAEPVAQAGEALAEARGVEHLPVDPRRRCEDRRAMRGRRAAARPCGPAARRRSAPSRRPPTGRSARRRACRSS